jgi:hypothetical protein
MNRLAKLGDRPRKSPVISIHWGTRLDKAAHCFLITLHSSSCVRCDRVYRRMPSYLWSSAWLVCMLLVRVRCCCRCGDLYEDKAVNVFNACAVSEQKCVPQAVTENAYPVPPDSVLDDTFDLQEFQGRWYITAGYNKLFDTFDCQEHYFMNPEPGKMFGKIQWRIQRSDGDFIERETVQRFLQVRALQLSACCRGMDIDYRGAVGI